MNLTYSHTVIICVMQFVSLVAVDIYFASMMLGIDKSSSLAASAVKSQACITLIIYVYINVMAVFGYIHVTILIFTKLVQCSVESSLFDLLRHTRDIALLTSYLPGCTRAATAPKPSGTQCWCGDTSCCRE